MGRLFSDHLATKGGFLRSYGLDFVSWALCPGDHSVCPGDSPGQALTMQLHCSEEARPHLEVTLVRGRDEGSGSPLFPPGSSVSVIPKHPTAS